jgi:hypothetical protein
MNALIAAVDKDGRRLTGLAASTWEFRPGGMRLVSGRIDLPVIVAEGVPYALEILTMDGDHVMTTNGTTFSDHQLQKGDVLRIRTGEVDFE